MRAVKRAIRPVIIALTLHVLLQERGSARGESAIPVQLTENRSGGPLGRDPTQLSNIEKPTQIDSEYILPLTETNLQPKGGLPGTGDRSHVPSFGSSHSSSSGRRPGIPHIAPSTPTAHQAGKLLGPRARSPRFSNDGILRGIGILERLFAPSCPLHWQSLASVANDFRTQQQTIQGGETTLVFEGDSGKTALRVPQALRLSSHPFRLSAGETTTIFAEVIDSKGQVVPTDCGSVSLQLMQREAPSGAPQVSGLGAQLLKGGQARWTLTVNGFVYPFLVLEATPRLCRSSLPDGLLLIDSIPDGQFVQSAALVLELDAEDIGNAHLNETPQLPTDSGLPPLRKGPSKSHTSSTKTLIATVNLLTGVAKGKWADKCRGRHKARDESAYVLRNSSNGSSVPPERALTAKECNDCKIRDLIRMQAHSPASRQQAELDVACEQLELAFDLMHSEVTLSEPSFSYSFRLPRKPLMPVTVAIVPRIQSSDISVESAAALSTPFDTNMVGAFPNNEQLTLIVDGEPRSLGHTIRLEPEAWNQQIVVALELSVAAAISAAISVDADRQPLNIEIAHILSTPESSGRDHSIVVRDMQAMQAQMARTVSVRCRVHTYFDDSAAEQQEGFGGVWIQRPVSVRCWILPSSDVRGEIRVKVTGGRSMRIISPEPGTELVLFPEQSGGLNDTQTKERSLASWTSGDHPVNWDHAEISAVVLPEAEGCVNSSCTLSFDLGLRDERRGGDLRILPLGGKVATLPENPTRRHKNVHNMLEETQVLARLARAWSLMPANEARTEITIPDLLTEVAASCFTAKCEESGRYPVEAIVRCGTAESTGNAQDHIFLLEVYVQLSPAVSSRCQLFDTRGSQIGELQVVATTSTSCGDTMFYNRDTGKCEPCPRSFSCSGGRLLQCAAHDEVRSYGIEAEGCSLCPVGKT